MLVSCSGLEQDINKSIGNNVTRSLNGHVDFEYPSSFKHYESHDHAIKSCAIPHELITKISTAEIMELCAKYPMALDVFFYDSPLKGIDYVISKFNGLVELQNRKDNFITVFSYIKKLYSTEIDYKTLTTLEVGNDILRKSYLELLLCNDKILSNASAGDLSELSQFSREQYLLKRKSSTYYGIEPLAITGLLYVKATGKDDLVKHYKTYTFEFINFLDELITK